ncbi:MFS transporter [Dehalococcoidia bacterium]|nr:MFS transporter [Dehalococcoidia bacterium]
MYNALASRDFRLLWLSSSIHVIGEVSTFIAQGWIVLSLTGDSALWVGIASGIRGAGHIGFGMVGGVLADRLKRRALLANLALFRAVTFAILAVLIFSGTVQLWHVMVMVFVQGSTDGLATPSFNGLIYDTVGPNRLMNAMAYILAALHISWTGGSILTGHLISTIGVGSAYAIGTVSCLLSILPLNLMETANLTQAREEPIVSNIVQGIRYVTKNSSIMALLLLSVLAEAFGFSYLIMLPVIAKMVLNVGPTGLGYLTAAAGVGSLIGTAVVAGLSDFKDKWKLLTIGTLSAGVSILLFAFSLWYQLSLMLVALIGFFLVIYDATINTLLQTLSVDNMRGRVLGLYGMSWGFTPVGGFVAGSVANIAGGPFAVGLGGVIILAYTIGVIARINQNRSQG